MRSSDGGVRLIKCSLPCAEWRVGGVPVTCNAKITPVNEGVGERGGGPPLRDHLWQGPPVTRNAEIDPGDNDPPPKMTQGVMTPLTPLHHLQQHPRAGSQGVGIATLIFCYFLRFFSSTHRTDLSRFRGTFHSFDPVGFAIFAIPQAASVGVGAFAARTSGRCSITMQSASTLSRLHQP